MNTVIPLIVGFVFGASICVFFSKMSFDRDRSLYPVILSVIAFYYPLFGLIYGSGIGFEFVVAAIFTLFSFSVGAKNTKILAGGYIIHGFYDLGHHSFGFGSETPLWWPEFCFAFDLMVGLHLLVIDKFNKRPG